MHIKLDDLASPEIAALLQVHMDLIVSVTPRESIHALDLDGLRKPEITFWSAWQDEDLVGCGALKELDPQHGEIKSMRTAVNQLRRGFGARILEFIVEEGRQLGYRRLSLETGSQPYFEPARMLYTKFGFEECEPFAHYVPDPNSVFMTKEL